MIFVFKTWEDFCKKLNVANIKSITARDVMESKAGDKYLVLKHDVETDVKKAYLMAQIENKYGHKGSYYVQAYLLESEQNIALLREMQYMGHEISYHYDVLDSSKGDLNLAIEEYKNYLERFKNNGFNIKTVCQHGNPVVERVGYTSNRDFFRSDKVQELYPATADIMVDFKTKANTEYTYFSDAGRKFKLILDPINNDVIDSEDKNIAFEDLDKLFQYILKENCIISTHPHRWEESLLKYLVKTTIFKIIRTAAKIAMKIPFLKKIMSRYYYLAKKI